MDLTQFSANVSNDPPPVPASLVSGYPQDGSTAGPVAATQPGAYFFYQLIAEFHQVITDAGLSPDHTSLDQLSTAIQTLISNISGVPAGTLLPFYGTAAPNGYILVDDGTIGSSASTATTRANDDTSALYTLLWDSINDTWCPVIGGRGADAAADFAANKELTIPTVLGRALAIAGAGSGLSARALGEWLGEEDHLQLLAELVAHTHESTKPQQNFIDGANLAYTSLTDATSNSAGGGLPFNIMQPTSFINAIIKL